MHSHTSTSININTPCHIYTYIYARHSQLLSRQIFNCIFFQFSELENIPSIGKLLIEYIVPIY
jgi:hypothetical protein